MTLSSYPRPHLRRSDSTWFHLHKKWDYKIVDGHLEDDFEVVKQQLAQADGQVQVPYSIETELSGVNRLLLPHQTLLMRLHFDSSIELLENHILHFDAVDQRTHVWLNGQYLGYHEDGYLPFSFDVSNVLQDKNNELILSIIDESDQGEYPWGKQKLKRGGIWYTPQSGIWQPVWIESCPQDYIQSFYYEYKNQQVSLKVLTNHHQPVQIKVFEPTLEGKTDVDFTLKDYPLLQTIPIEQEGSVSLDIVKLWSATTPWLYPIELTCGEDVVRSYFGCRTLEIKDNPQQIKKVFINDQEEFQSGILDQGYFQKGLYTPDSDQMLIDDLVMLKEMGFNMVRKHIKVELARWYYHCDRLGLYVHQDMVSSGQKYNPLIIQV
ncbi:MAG: glycoside hydrolase family 2, partial [Erysipelothrix sp.]|nr:glycoside hydrolase family 2 [Erysipelothrix sp.]